MATTKQVIRALEKVLPAALELAAGTLLKEVESSIPIDHGELRTNHKISRVGKRAVEIRNDLPYARTQYLSRLFHPIIGDQFTPMTNLVAPSASTTGSGKKGLYSSSYKKAKEAGLLTQAEPRWFDIGNDRLVKRRMSDTFTKAVRGALRKVR